MFREYRILLLLSLFLLAGGCTDPSWTTAGKIIPPVYGTCPLEGKWSVIGEPDQKEYPSVKQGEKATLFQFSHEVALLGDKVGERPTYKVKKVNARDYLLTRYVALDNSLAMIDQEVSVVTLFDDYKYLGEFMKIDEVTVVSFIQNEVRWLHKYDDYADHPSSFAGWDAADGCQNSTTGSSGVFIGLKIPSNNEYLYKTIWIAAQDKELGQVLGRDDIYFPRKSGFWELQVTGGANQKEAEVGLMAHNVAIKDAQATKDKTPLKTLNQGNPVSAEIRSICVDYISNDYVVVDKNLAGISQLQVLPVDTLSSSVGVKISDLLGDTGATIYYNAREQALRTLNDRGLALTDADINGENLGLVRKNGHWRLRGRIGYQQDGSLESMDFDINLIPPPNLVFYDTLYLGWQSIKDRVPNALDAFTSPNRDIAIVKTKSRFYFFGMEGEQLDSVPLGEIELQEGTTVIMAEWATGSYVNDWEQAFIADGARSVTGMVRHGDGPFASSTGLTLADKL